MNRATPKLRDLVERLNAYEMKRNDPSETRTSAGRRAFEKFRPQLAALIGNVGYSALVSRALALGFAEAPWLRAVQVKTVGSLDGFEELGAQVDPDEYFEGWAI
jgi:hypothetical protein